LVSVVICNYNGARHLHDCLRSLREQTYPAVEIIVSDNASTDNSAAICASHKVRFVSSGVNKGLAWAYNAGVRESRGEYAFVTNNDMWFAPDCVEKLVAAMHRHGDSCFAADPLQYNWDQTEIIHSRGVLRPLAHPRELVNQAFSVFPLVAQAQVACDTEDISYMASAGAMLLRRSMFDQLGGFDEQFFLDWEDVDLCWRANLRGWDSIFVPTARLRHKWKATTEQVTRQFGKVTPLGYRCAVSQQYNMMRFALKNYGGLNALAFVILRLASTVVHPFRGQAHYARAGIHAFVEVLRTMPDILRNRREVRRTARVSNRELFRRFRIEYSHNTWRNSLLASVNIPDATVNSKGV
jgi:GT2 family glycosyltransferase